MDSASTPLDASELPGLLAEIAAAAGVEAAVAVAEKVGGTRAYFPGRPDPDHWLSTTVGHDKAAAICAAIAPGIGVELYVPMGPAGARARLWRVMHGMIAAGANTPEIVRATGLSPVTVRRHRRTLRRAG